MSDHMPVLFVSHGAPTLPFDDVPARRFLIELARKVPRPKAILCVSAHWEATNPSLNAAAQPGTIHDFSGFPKALYELTYDAPGAPEVAERAAALLRAAGYTPTLDAERGRDHGAWVPAMLAWPAGEIPMIQLSLLRGKSTREHIALGEAIAPLRDEGVLLVGSGHITHNLRAYFSTMRQGAAVDPELAGKVEAFTQWFAQKLAANDTEALLDWKRAAPFPADNHPTDEHLMPIFFAYGAAGAGAKAERVHNSVDHGFFANDSYLFH